MIGLGDIQYELGKTDSAIVIWKQAIDIESEIGDKRGISRLKILNCLASNVFGNNEEALNYHLESIAIAEALTVTSGRDS